MSQAALVGIVHLFNRLKNLGVSLLSGLGQRLLMETPLPWHSTISNNVFVILIYFPDSLQVYLSVGDGTTLLSRFAKASGGKPSDVSAPRFAVKHLPTKTVANLMKRMSDAIINHEGYGLRTEQTKLPLTGGAAMINDELPFRILTGRVQCKPR